MPVKGADSWGNSRSGTDGQIVRCTWERVLPLSVNGAVVTVVNFCSKNKLYVDLCFWVSSLNQ